MTTVAIVQTYAEGIVPKDTPTLSEDGKTVQFGSSSSSNISVNALFPGSDADPDQVIKALQDGADGAISTANDNKRNCIPIPISLTPLPWATPMVLLGQH